MNRMPGCRVMASQSFGKKYGIVLAEINEILLRLTALITCFGSSPVPGTFPSLSSNFQVTLEAWFGDQLVNYIDQPIYFPS